MSVAQFVRDAALTRLVYMAGRRGDVAYERALERLASPVPSTEGGTAAGARAPR